MYARRKVDERRGMRKSRLPGYLSAGPAPLRMVRLMAFVFVAFALLTGSAYAAGGVGDALCDVCGAASDPVQFSFMAGQEGLESAVESPDALALASVVSSDPVQYTFSVRQAVDLAREAEIERLQVLSGPGARSLTGVDEKAHLLGLAEAAAIKGAAELVREAEIARLRALLSDPGAWSLTGVDEKAHLLGLAKARSAAPESYCAVLSGSPRVHAASAARLTGLAAHYLGEEPEGSGVAWISRGRLADAGRFTGLAAGYGGSRYDGAPAYGCLVAR